MSERAFTAEDRALMERAKSENWPTGDLLRALRDQRRRRREREGRRAVAPSSEAPAPSVKEDGNG